MSRDEVGASSLLPAQIDDTYHHARSDAEELLHQSALWNESLCTPRFVVLRG